MSLNSNKITPHPPGSLREILFISAPLILTLLSSSCSILVDRMFLLYYSIQDYSACVQASSWILSFVGFFASLGGITKVFVARYFSKNVLQLVGSPVWQAIWIQLCFSVIILPPLYIYGTPIIFGDDALGSSYFHIVLMFSTVFGIAHALGGFFTAIGQTKTILYSVIVANVVNIVLDYALIFGIPNIVDSLGITGAAIGTAASYLIQAVILFSCFAGEHYNRIYFTRQFHLSLPLAKECLRLGLGYATVILCEMLGFAMFYQLMDRIGLVHITISGICQTCIFLFYCILDGSFSGATALYSFYRARSDKETMLKVLKMCLYMQLLFISIYIFLFFVPTDTLIDVMFKTTKKQITIDSYFKISLHNCIILAFAYLVIDACKIPLAAALLAEKKILFLGIVSSFAVWIISFSPLLVIYILNHTINITVAWIFHVMSPLSCLIAYFVYYKQIYNKI